MSENPIFFIFLLFALIQGGHSQRKLICLDNKSDVDIAGWKSNTEIKSVENVAALPKSFGDLKSLMPENGIWYIEGPSVSGSSGNDVTFKSPSTLYTTKAKSINIYIKYYIFSPRRVSLYPVKPGSTGGNLFLLPVSTQVKWNEVRQEIDPNESPIELTAYLSSNQFVLFEKIILAIDSPLPSDLSMSCKSLTSLPVLSSTAKPPSSWTTTGSATRKPTQPTQNSPSSLTDLRSDCPAFPPVPECKCNCLCNCSKC